MNRYTKKILRGLLPACILLLIAFVCAIFIRGNLFPQQKRLFSSRQSDSNTSLSNTEHVSPSQSDADSARSLANEEFETFLDDLFRQEASSNALSLHYILENPESYDISSYNTDLGIYSAENTRISAALAENLLETLSGFDVTALNTDNRITFDVLKSSLENTRTAASFPYYEEPLRVSTGEQAELPVLLAEYTFHSRRDIEDYLAILGSIPSYFSGICQYEREKSERGLFMPDFAADTIISQCRDFAASADNNYLIYTFDEKVDAFDGLSKNEILSYKQQNKGIVTERVLPAFLEIADTLSEIRNAESSVENSNRKISFHKNYNTDFDTYVNTDASAVTIASVQKDVSAGLCSLPEGRSYYEFLVKQYTGSSDTVVALQKRTEEKREYDLQRAALLLASYPDLEYDMISASAPCSTPEEMLTLLQKKIADDFPTVTECEYTLKYVDPAMEDYMAPAFYLTAPLDHYTENAIYINEKNGYEGLRLFTTLAHEGFPGHLYQNAVFSSTDPSPIRALLGTAGYTEGWATYVEMLSYRYAGLSPETAEALALEQSAILSLYATADMGIHYDGWTFADTLRFFSDYGFTDEDTIRDIFELIVEEPAHYLKYYIGYLEFINLKEYAKKTDGEDYSDLSFHRAVLEMGAAPFSILQKHYPSIRRNEGDKAPG